MYTRFDYVSQDAYMCATIHKVHESVYGGNISILRNMSTAERVHVLFPRTVFRPEGMRRLPLRLTTHQELAPPYDQIRPSAAQTRFVPWYLDFIALKHWTTPRVQFHKGPGDL